MNAQTEREDRSIAGPLARGIGLHGWVMVTCAMAGGLVLGGVVVGVMTTIGRMTGHALFLVSTSLFVIGAFLGLMHGSILGFFGRSDGVTPRRARQDLGIATLYAIPGLAVAWLLTIWISMTVVARSVGRVGTHLGVLAGWVGGLAVIGVAAFLGYRALANAYARWPDRRIGTVLVMSTFGALVVLFLAEQPKLWGLHLQVTEVGAVLLAIGATLWIAGPIITLGLRELRSVPWRRRPVLFGHGFQGAVDVGLGLVVGLVIGLLALPFVGPVAGSLGGTEGVLTAVSQALVEEVLLRLFLTTSVMWLILRWHSVHPEEAAVMSVLGAAVVQLLLYVPSIAAIGFSTNMAAVVFALVGVLLPAAAFGALYWTRGFGTALLADATALVLIALLAL
jgi:hypothetical protein